MKKLLLSFALISCSFIAFSQTIVKDAAGNYKMVKAAKDSSTDKPTGKTMTDLQGKEWPVYISKTGRPYALRVSKKGTSYKQYLDKKVEPIIIADNKQIN